MGAPELKLVAERDSAEEYRTCPKCGETKPVTDFLRDPRRSPCKLCWNAASREYKRQYAKKWRKYHADYNTRRYHETKKRDPLKYMLRVSRNRARRDDVEFSITVEDIAPLPTVCPVLGIPLTAPGNGLGDNSPTIDRLDPRRGYVPGNVVIISMRANRFKL